MERNAFQAWLAEPAFLASVLALLEARIEGTRRYPHCSTDGAVIRGCENGLRRYCCKACCRSFNALTGTPLARQRKKELWAAFAAGLSEGDTVKGAAGRCGVADTTSFRWRQRFLAAVKADTVKLKGIVEADETYVLTSRKGARKLDHKARKRGGVAQKRGLSPKRGLAKEQVPILVALRQTG